MDKKARHPIRKAIKILLISLGVITSLMLLLALTPAPYRMHYRLGEDPSWEQDGIPFHPEYVVMLGGAGMPSESNLLRLYFTAEIAMRIDKPIILVHPEDSICQSSMSQLLIKHGISCDSIDYMTVGGNTRAQVMGLKEHFPALVEVPFLIVTAPENMYRTLKCFSKAGFSQIRGISAQEASVDFDLTIKDKNLEGNRLVPKVDSPNLRYNFWNYLKLEITCLREYCAIAYYKIKGWI